MSQIHKVKRGDCIVSIAKRYGLLPDVIWDHPANSELVARRERGGNVLLPGDTVVIPVRKCKQVSGATEQRHRFVLRGHVVEFKLQVETREGPRANEDYELEIDGRLLLKGTTDGNGLLKERIPADAGRGELRFATPGQEEEEDEDLGYSEELDDSETDADDELGEGVEAEVPPSPHVYRLHFGAMDPITNETGIQARLANLGFYGGKVDGEMGPLSKAAVARLQAENELASTGEADQATLDALRNAYGY